LNYSRILHGILALLFLAAIFYIAHISILGWPYVVDLGCQYGSSARICDVLLKEGL
jgi:hypothetical protein